MISSREVISILKKSGWQLRGVVGDHHHFGHPDQPGKVTVPHPIKDLSLKTLRSIERSTGLKMVPTQTRKKPLCP